MNRDYAIGFLAGAIDGEGSFMLKPTTDLRTLRKGRPSLSIRASMEIENTSKAFIDKVEEALQVIVVSSFQVYRNFRGYDKVSYFKRYGFKPMDNTVLGGGKNYYRLSVAGRNNLKLLINEMRGEFTVKKEAVKIIEEFFAQVGDDKHHVATMSDLNLSKALYELQGRRRKPYPLEKWTACLAGDWDAYDSHVKKKDEPTPYQADGSENDAVGRRRD